MTTRFDPLYTVLIGYYALGVPEKMIDAYSRLIDSSILIGDHPDSLEIEDNHNGISSKQIAMADAELCNMSNDDELDDLSRYNATVRHEHTNKLLISARLLAPSIAWEESQGYAKLSDILREKGHHGISLQVQMSMALTLLKRNEFEKATDIMLRIDREGLESALALGINVPPSILQKTRNLSLTAAATAVTNQESDLHLLGIDPSVLANQQSVVDRDAVASRGAPEMEMLKTDDDSGTKKQPYAAFVPRGVHTNIAFIYYLKGDYEASARHAQIALEIDPYDSFAHINLGCTYSKTNQWELSLREFLKAQEINMESVQAIYNAGLVYFKQQEYKTAYSCFQKVANKLPSYGDAIYMSADCLARMSQIDEAIQMLSNLVTVFSTAKAYDPSIYIRLGELYSIAGDEGQAAHYFKEAHRLVPFSLAVINWLGSHYIKNELYEQARVCFEKASRVDTTTPKWSLAVAACLRKSRQYREAIYEYKHILKRFPANTTAMTHLISSLNNIGQHKEADEWAEKFAKLTNNKMPDVAEDRELDEFVKQERRNSVAAVGSRAGHDKHDMGNNKISSNTGDLFGDVDIAEELLTEN
ncbi:Putative TPR repeat family protein [Giardia duodenalis]|nr:Putative TPR repeat family protein [Giardia intestinalis]